MADTSELPTKDFSIENPKLHWRYVTYAQQELQMYERMIEELQSLSRVNPSIMAGLIMEERAKLVRSDAAYKEAAWRLLAGDLLPADGYDPQETETEAETAEAETAEVEHG